MIAGSRRGPAIKYSPALDGVRAKASAVEQEQVDFAEDLSELREDPDIVALIGKAKRNEKNPPRKHHVVPASFLRRWTEERQLRVTEVDEGRSWITTAEKAGRRTDYYNLASEDLDPDQVPPLLAETLLSEIEALGKNAIDALLDKGVKDLSHQERSDLAVFLGFQSVRGDSTREMIRKVANDDFKIQYGQLNNDGIRRELIKRGLEATEASVAESAKFITDLNEGSVTVGPQRPAEVMHAFQMALKVAEVLYDRHWATFKTAPILLTCDEPVIPLGCPGDNRAELTGIADARAIIFPLAPDSLLVMFRNPPSARTLAPLTHQELAEINHEVIAHAARWAFERPRRKTSMALRVPPRPQATQIVEHEVTGKPNTSIVRLFKPSRWAESSHPPTWPVSKWLWHSPFSHRGSPQP